MTEPETEPIWVSFYKREIQNGIRQRLPHVVIAIIYECFDTFESFLAPFQQKAFHHCVGGLNVFITGPAGCGKTYLLDSIVRQLRAPPLHKTVIVTATTGVAACMIGGQTLHSFSKLNRMREKLDLGDFHADDYKSIWHEVDVLIIDEISMLAPADFALLVRVWRELDLLPTLQVILLGDFYQLPPVIKDEKKTKEAFCFETAEWNELIDRSVYLYDVFRQSDQAFVRTLNLIRTGQFTAFDIERLQRRYVQHPAYVNARPIFDYSSEYTWIFPTNAEADRHNQDILSQLKGDTHIFHSIYGIKQLSNKRTQEGEFIFTRHFSTDHVDERDQKYFTETYRKQFACRDLLKLKVGLRVMLTINLNTQQGLVNGACGVITKFDKYHKHPSYKDQPLPVVEFDNGVVQHVLFHEWQTIVERTVQKQPRTQLFCIQLPLQYAYATTIHKSQGKTLKNLVLSLRRTFGEAGGYVGISRAQSLKDLHLMDPVHASQFRVHKKVHEFYEGICTSL